MAEQKLAGRVALVTGAAKRIGRSIALELAQRGAHVVVNYRSSRGDAEQVVAEIVKMGRRSIAVQANVSVRAEVQHMISRVEAEFGGLDILVNNAVMFQHVAFNEITDEQWAGILATNLTSQFLCAQTAAPLLKRSGRGSIINLAPLGRTGKGSDIAEAVAFLAESDFITGQVLVVDGGRSIT